MADDREHTPIQIPVGSPSQDPLKSASASSSAAVGGIETSDTKFFGQPKALANIFGVEMWERFSFYGMQGILLIYMYFSVTEGGLGIDRAVATGIVGAYGGSVYLFTIVGAWLADRVMGSERVLFYSAIVIMAGHIALAVLPNEIGLGIGLVLIAIGSGGLKASATSVVGTLYAEGDNRRDAGFSLFYLGINLGAFLGPIITGLLQSTVGFHWGFGAAAVGMAIGLLQYSFGRHHLPESSRVATNPLPSSQRLRMILLVAAALLIIVLLVFVGVIRADNLAGIVIVIVLGASIAYFIVIIASKQISALERSRVTGFIPLFIVNVGFWSLYQQQFTVLTIYSDEQLNRDIFGWTMPISWVNSINPVFIIVLSGVFAAIWTKFGSRAPSAPVKFALGAMIMGAAFLLFIPWAGSGKGGTPLIAMIAILFVFTVAELFISPPGLSVTTKLAPQKFRTQMVALYFLSISLGTSIAGWLAQFYDPANELPYFSTLGVIAIAIGILMLFTVKPVLALMRGVR